jgi:predicted O-methyltransferase YrrM
VSAVKGNLMDSSNTTTRVERAQSLIDRLFDTCTVVARSDGSVHELFPVSIPRAEGEALREWVRSESAIRTIETGFGYGISALFICQGLIAADDPSARHVVIDPNQSGRFADTGLQVIEEAGLSDLIEIHPEPSEIVLPRFLADGRRFDLGFIDGNHRFDGVFLDIIYLGRLVRAGGILFVDDYQLPAVARAVSFCTSNLDWALEEVSEEQEDHHWAVLRTARVPLERAFDNYVEF